VAKPGRTITNLTSRDWLVCNACRYAVADMRHETISSLAKWKIRPKAYAWRYLRRSRFPRLCRRDQLFLALALIKLSFSCVDLLSFSAVCLGLVSGYSGPSVRGQVEKEQVYLQRLRGNVSGRERRTSPPSCHSTILRDPK
jgi:hypothetical protein